MLRYNRVKQPALLEKSTRRATKPGKLCIEKPPRVDIRRYRRGPGSLLQRRLRVKAASSVLADCLIFPRQSWHGNNWTKTGAKRCLCQFQQAQMNLQRADSPFHTAHLILRGIVSPGDDYTLLSEISFFESVFFFFLPHSLGSLALIKIDNIAAFYLRVKRHTVSGSLSIGIKLLTPGGLKLPINLILTNLRSAGRANDCQHKS